MLQLYQFLIPASLVNLRRESLIGQHIKGLGQWNAAVTVCRFYFSINHCTVFSKQMSSTRLGKQNQTENLKMLSQFWRTKNPNIQKAKKPRSPKNPNKPRGFPVHVVKFYLPNIFQNLEEFNFAFYIKSYSTSLLAKKIKPKMWCKNFHIRCQTQN